MLTSEALCDFTSQNRLKIFSKKTFRRKTHQIFKDPRTLTPDRRPQSAPAPLYPRSIRTGISIEEIEEKDEIEEIDEVGKVEKIKMSFPIAQGMGLHKG